MEYKMRKPKTKPTPVMKVYVCKTTYKYELSDCPDVKLYSSIEELKKAHRCVASGECGIVQLKVNLKTRKIVEPSHLPQ